MKNVELLKDYGHYGLDWWDDDEVSELKKNVIEKCDE